MKKIYKATKKNQSGVTLLIAILILSVVMAVSFSLASILLAESRSSGDLLRTEPALYGAVSVTEEALYSVKRVQGSTAQLIYSNQVGKTKLSNVTTPLNDPIQTVKIDTGTVAFNNTPNDYLLYDPANVYGASNYTRLKITFLDTHTIGAELHIYVCQWDPANPPQNTDGSYKTVCTDPNDSSYMTYQGGSSYISPGETWDTQTECGGCINPNFQQQLFLYQTSLYGNPTSPVYVQIQSFGTGGTPLGLPYFGKTAVDISAVGSDVNRKVRVVIPNNN